MPSGRLTDYGPAIIEKATKYLNKLPKGEVIHSIEGLSVYLKIARSTIYEWIKHEDKVAFSDIVAEILSKQGQTLINRGLTGRFNASITKVILTKHGYREGIEHSGNEGGPVKIDVSQMLKKVYGDGEVPSNS